MQARLLELLHRVQADAGPAFSGLGVLISDHPERLPLAPLRASISIPDKNLAAALSTISQHDGGTHDGFHLISSSFQLIRISQLLAPPIPADFHPNPARPFGARFLAARLGSLLPDVVLAGVASRNSGIAIFEAGAEIVFEPAL